MNSRILLRNALVAITFVVAASSARAQSDIRLRIREAGGALATADSSLGHLEAAQRERVVEFVAGNALFTLSHELGHAVIGELNLPVLGREEDAADSFAILALLHVGTEFTHRVLVDAARGLLLIGERDLRMGVPPAFYDEHGLDQQRAYTIICLMVGSDPARFGDLAQRANLPAERQETCQGDYDQAKDSWMRLLRSHLRAGARPSFWERLNSPRARLFGTPQSSVAISYGDASGRLAPYREIMMTLHILDEVRDFTAKNFKLPRPLTIEAKTCGEPNAYWDAQDLRIVLCYELLAFHAKLAVSR